MVSLFYSPGERKWGWASRLGLYDGGWTEEREKEKGGRVKEGYKEKRMEERER